MQFHTFTFAIFLPLVFILYWIPRNSKKNWQNSVLLLASYVFYGWWDYRFLALLAFSTSLDYFSGIKIGGSSTKAQKKAWLILSISANLFFLGIFKYFNFFIQSFSDGLNQLGIDANMHSLKIILPVGISFYTFHGLSYVLDIYHEKIKPSRNPLEYSLFVSFFPLLVAGPIERATHLLPQLETKRKFNFQLATDGMRQFLWGLFKKVVIADTCAVYADKIFEHSGNYSGLGLVAGVFLFSVQIYADFSGYSDMALGISRLLGIELLRNFSFPYFSRDIAEFWRRWHISLTSWFRDYIYIPLGGSRLRLGLSIRNTFIIFLISGFWHGANWTFLCWGFLHAAFFLPLLLLKKNRKNTGAIAEGKFFPSVKEFAGMLTTFTFVTFAWIFFRAKSMTDAFHFISGIFSGKFFSMPSEIPFLLFLLIFVFFIIEWLGRENDFAIRRLADFRNPVIRYGVYYLLVFFILHFTGKGVQFLYFQF